MITETKTERGRTVLTVETEEEIKQAFGRMLEDESLRGSQDYVEGLYRKVYREGRE